MGSSPSSTAKPAIGASPIDIKDQLRHSDIRVTTDFYIGTNSAHQKKQIEKLADEDFRRFLDQLKITSKAVKEPLKNEARFGTPQEVLPIASAWNDWSVVQESDLQPTD